MTAFFLRAALLSTFALSVAGCASSRPSGLGATDASHNFYRQPDDTIDTQASLYGVQPPYGPGSDVPGEVNHD